MLQVMSEIGIEHPDDMSELDDDDVEAICSTLTKIGAKRFQRTLLLLQAENSTVGGAGEKQERSDSQEVGDSSH